VWRCARRSSPVPISSPDEPNQPSLTHKRSVWTEEFLANYSGACLLSRTTGIPLDSIGDPDRGTCNGTCTRTMQLHGFPSDKAERESQWNGGTEEEPLPATRTRHGCARDPGRPENKSKSRLRNILKRRTRKVTSRRGKWSSSSLLRRSLVRRFST